MKVTYAQTNLQLFTQLEKDGYSATELGLICDAYALAMRLYSCYYTASGRTEIAHVVGTASILGVLKAPASVVAAGLIHNAYDNGDFGSYRYGVTPAKRKVIMHAVGEDVERYIQTFHILRTQRQSLTSLIGDIDTLNDIERFALLIDLSERLEHELNDGGLQQYRKYMDLNGCMMVNAAQKLQFPHLADAILNAIKHRNAANSIVRELAERSSGNRSQWIVPASCRKRFTFLCYTAMVDGLRRVRRNRIVRRARALFGHF
jgi:Domain of unknown function (DUF6817)